MKIASLLLIIIAVFVIYWFVKVDGIDNKARKEATQVKVTVEKVRCKKRLKSDKNYIVVNYKSKPYTLYLSEKRCSSFKSNDVIKAYYSESFDKLFIDK